MEEEGQVEWLNRNGGNVPSEDGECQLCSLCVVVVVLVQLLSYCRTDCVLLSLIEAQQLLNGQLLDLVFKVVDVEPANAFIHLVQHSHQP